MLTASQCAEFEEKGFVRVPAAFTREEAAAMERRVWGWLERKYAVSRTDPTTWSVSAPTGLQGLKRHAVFEPIGSAVTCAALDALLGAGRWKRPRDWGGFLVNFPSAGTLDDSEPRLAHRLRLRGRRSSGRSARSS